MKNNIKLLFVNSVFSILLLFSFSFKVYAQEKACSLKQGKKWRVGYIEAGDNKNFYENSFKGLIQGLRHIGLIDNYNNTKGKGTEGAWNWLSKESKSYCIEFVQDAYWESSGDKKEEQNKRIKNKESIIDRLKNKKDLDLIIAMGTRAGKDMVEANDHHETNTNIMIMEASDPVQSGLVKKIDKSGRSRIHVMIEPDRYKDQIDFFVREFQETKGRKLKKLGIVYIDNPNGKVFAAFDIVRAKGEQLDFHLESCPLPAEASSWPRKKLVKQVQECYEKLAPNVDAIYMTSHLSIEKEDMCSLIKPILKHRVPTWSQNGGFEVEYGALMSYNRPDPADVGVFEANVMGKIFHGTHPGDISQIFKNPKGEEISLNLRTAQLIRYNPSWSVLAAAEHVFDAIEMTTPGKDCNE